MPKPRFLQIHTLSAYTAALLNRDDSDWRNACLTAAHYVREFLPSASNGIGALRKIRMRCMPSTEPPRHTGRANW